MALAGPTGNFRSWPGERATWAKRCSTAAWISSAVVGIGFLLNGNILVGVWNDSLIVRLGPEEGEEALKEPHVKEFDITGRAMKGWAVVAPEGVGSDDQLRGWIQRAVKFAGKLPAKEK